MFGDAAWIESRTNRQMARFENWFAALRQPVVVELGAGRAIPTVRYFSERHGPRVIRINPREYAIDPRWTCLSGSIRSARYERMNP
jgi:hypothetical protein